MKRAQKLDLRTLRLIYDVKETETCKTKHKLQWIEKDQKGFKWQYCTECDRKLLVA